MTTYYALGLMSPAESWRGIRTLRAEPPGAVTAVLRQPDRKLEFHTGLEQAQQQYHAGSRIGYESRAINMFYGLTQAGRALCAASPRLGVDGEHWRGQGHGLKFDPDCPPDRLFQQRVRKGGAGDDLFTKVSRAIGSPHQFGEADFGAVVNQLCDYTIAFPQGDGYARPIDAASVYDLNLTEDLELRVPGLPEVGTVPEETVRRLLADYPALADVPMVMDGADGVRRGHNQGCVLIRVIGSQLEQRGGVLHLRGTTLYRHIGVYMPQVGQLAKPLEPLMAWWLTLFSLGMVARYAPSRWMRMLSLAESPVSSRIEVLLDEALSAVPELVYRALRDLGDVAPR